jgi:uncharacterized protein
VTPTRIAIIAILVYILYRLLVGPRKKPTDSVPRSKGNRVGPIDDVLVKDPVCNTYIPQRQAIVLVHQHQTYYFCSETCRKTFLAEKEKE